MDDNKIPSLTDEAWAKQDELGTIERTMEYNTANGKRKVNAVAHIVSGSEMEALSASLMETDKDGKPKLDDAKFSREVLKLVFRLDGSLLQNIYENKSSDLRSNLSIFANEVCGMDLTKEEVEEQKNSDGLDQSRVSSQ